MKKISVCFVILVIVLMMCMVQTTFSAELIQAPSDDYTYHQNIDFIQVEGGENHTAFLSSSGEVYVTGCNFNGQLGNNTTTNSYSMINITSQFSLEDDEKIIKIALGYEHSAALSNDGNLFMWGRNYEGQLGDGTSTRRISPTNVTDQFDLDVRETIIHISLGYRHSLVLTNYGKVFSFGYNNHGQLGNGNTTSLSTPVEITNRFLLDNGEIITAIEAGHFHSAALSSENNLFTWGYNSFGQLGDGTTDDKTSPIEITGQFSLDTDETIDSISFGAQHSSILTSKHRVFTWGDNRSGECGNSSSIPVYNPIDITNYFEFEEEESIEYIELGSNHALAITSQMRFFTWGNNNFGQLGDASIITKYEPYDITSTITLSDGEYPIDLGLGGQHSFYLTNQNTLMAWGRNNNGQLGNKTMKNQLAPIAVGVNYNKIIDTHFPLTDRLIKQSAGHHHNHALTASGRVFSWGFNNNGELGDSTKEDKNYPVDITSNFNLFENEKVIDITTSHFHSLALTSNHRIFAWGFNLYGQLGDGSSEHKDTPQDITSQFQFNTREVITSIETGYDLSFAVTSEGRLFIWGRYEHDDLNGDSSYYQKTPYDITSLFALDMDEKIISTALSYNHYAVLTSNNRIFVWGKNSFGQVGDGTTIDRDYPIDITSQFSLKQEENIIDIELGYYHSGLLTSAGTLFMWGENHYGQVGDGTFTQKLDPVNITSLVPLYFGDSITELSIGKYHSAVVSSFGYIFTWGANDYYQLGTNSTIDFNTPQDIKYRFNLSSSEKLIMPSLGASHSTVMTEEGRLYTWGSNSYGKLGKDSVGSEPIPFAINATLSELDQILYIDTKDEENYLKPYWTIHIYPKYDFKDEIKQITINNTVYELIQFEVSDGEITVQIPIDGELGDEITITINSITLINDEMVTMTTNNSTTTTLVEDNVLPTIYYDYDQDLYIEQGINGDQFLDANAIDDTLEELSITRTGVVDWDTPGAYKIYYSTTDFSGNTLTEDRTVIIMPSISTDGTMIDDMIFHGFVSETYTESLELNNQTITYDETTYTSITDYSTVNYHVGWNDLEFAFEIYNRYVIVSKAIYFEDVEPPTFDVIDDQVIELGLSDIDWTTMITNEEDNSDGILTKTEVEDLVDYNTPGTYTVTVSLTDEALNETSQTFLVTVEDTTAPVVTLNEALTTLEEGEEFHDPGIVVEDYSETTTTTEITPYGDSHELITYTVADAFGNTTIVKRVVFYYEATNEVEFVLEETLTTIEVGSTYEDTGCTATINGESFTCTVENNMVDTAIAGVYTITYSVEYNGETYTHVRYVFVYEVNDNGEQILYYRREEEVGVVV